MTNKRVVALRLSSCEICFPCSCYCHQPRGKHGNGKPVYRCTAVERGT
jgi:hypothetical protein